MLNRNPYKVVFAAGGTGGHIYPAIAIAGELQLVSPHIEVTFIGTTNRLESKIVPSNGYTLKFIPVMGLSRSLSIRNVYAIMLLVYAVIKCIGILRRERASLVVGTGGYVSAPTVIGALLSGIPVLMLEQNAIPGMVNKYLAKYAEEVHLSYEVTQKHLDRKTHSIISGNPIRRLSEVDRESARREIGIGGDNRTVLVFGGSLGASAINSVLLEHIDDIVESSIQMIWQTGSKDYQKVVDRVDQPNIRVYEYIDDMASAYSACDLVVCRAGATTIAELQEMNKPALLIPYPHSTDNHQYYNAKGYEEMGMGLVIEESEIRELVPRMIEYAIDDGGLELKRRDGTSSGSMNAREEVTASVMSLLKNTTDGTVNRCG